jgi:hypothetical protein
MDHSAFASSKLCYLQTASGPCLHLLLQVDQVSAQLKEAQQQLEDNQRLATSLSGAERGRLEAEEKLAAALRHNADTQVKLAELICSSA